MKKLFILFIVVAGFSVSSFGQSTDAANSTATLITPLSIHVDSPFGFGTLAATNTAGTVVLGTDGGLTPSIGVKAIGGSVTNAVFHVVGEPLKNISITAFTTDEAGAILTGAVGSPAEGHSLLLNAVIANPTLTTQLAITTGLATITLGATLNIPADSPAGLYSNTGDVKVTVNYQ